jgi:hypothetical protein
MNKLFSAIILTVLYSTVSAQDKTDEQKRDRAFYAATQKWFTAWKLVSANIYQIDNVRPVEFVFFDDKYVDSTSKTWH